MAYQHGMKAMATSIRSIKAMNTLGYEVGTLGNHEFNYGLDFMFKVPRAARISARLRQPDQGPAGFRPEEGRSCSSSRTMIPERRSRTAPVTRTSIKIGTSSASCRRRSALWDIKNLEGKAQTRDIVEAAKA